MIGCCGKELVKFRTRGGKVDNERLSTLEERVNREAKSEHLAQEILNNIKQCDCPCHIDGTNILC